jgi:2-dehydropantoate 2-reductase
MKIAVVGCGAVGSYYGAKLCRAGLDVHFLLRSDYEVVRRQGVFVRSLEGNFNVQPACAKSPEEIGESDLILIGLKTTANDRFPKLLPPLVGRKTAIITLQNGLGNVEQLARLFPADQILSGLCFVCLNRIKPGVIHHMEYGKIVLGEFQRPEEDRVQGIASLFRNAGIDCKVSDNLARAHWEKLVWNIPFNGLGVAGAAGYEALAHQPSTISDQLSVGPCLPTDRLLADARWEKLLRELMAEVIAAAGALGFVIPDSFAENQIASTRTMGTYKASTLIDFERGQPLELESLFLEPLRRAKKAGVAVPRLEALCRVLQLLENRKRR